MKNAFIGLLVILMVFGFIGCKDDDQIIPDPVPLELQGTWKLNTIEYILTKNTFKMIVSTGTFEVKINSYTIENNNIINNKNEEFPSGYKLKGNITSTSGGYESIFTIGNERDFIFFINVDKNKIISDGNYNNIFEKQ